MARSLLRSFVGGTRQMLTLQLLVSVGTIGLAGYTFVVTNNALRERNRLAERVIVLEEALGQAGIAPPQAGAAPAAPPEPTYPPSLEQTTTVTPEPASEAPPPEGATTAPPPVEVVEQPPIGGPPSQTTPPLNTDTPTTPPAATQPPAFDPGTIIRDLLTPPPALRTLVLHVRARTDVDEAQQIARELGANGLSVSIDVMPADDARQSGYAFYHARQNRAAAEMAQRVQTAARSAQIAAWSVQLRGASLPANGEYSADRLDVVLPPLPAAPVRDPRFNSQILRDRAVIQPQVQQQPPPQPTIR